MTIDFTVTGDPVPQGSVKAFIPKGWTRAVVTSTSGPKLKSWRHDVAAVAMCCAAQSRWSADGPMRVVVTFGLARPLSVSAKKRPHPTVRPDLDKLCRALLDALTGVLWNDDAQVIFLAATKQYQPPPVQTLVQVSNEEKS